MMKRLAHRLTELDVNDPYRVKMSEQLLDKAYAAALYYSIISKLI